MNFSVYKKTANLPFDSTILLSPTFLDSTTQSTSKTLLFPMTIVTVLPSSAHLKIKHCSRRFENLNKVYLFIICTCSSMILFSPMTIGPPKARIFALGWMTVRDPIVISPCNSHSQQTTAPLAIFALQKRLANYFMLLQRYDYLLTWLN